MTTSGRPWPPPSGPPQLTNDETSWVFGHGAGHDMEFSDVNDNHLGVNVSSFMSVASKLAEYVDVTLASGKLMQEGVR